MSISSTTRTAGPFIGNDSTTEFPFAFKVFADTELLVLQRDETTLVETTLTLNTDYSVSLNANQNSNPGGSVTLLAGALATGQDLFITSDMDNLQALDLTNQGGFYPETINDALDKLCIQNQQQQTAIDRSVKISNFDDEGDLDQLVQDITTLAADKDNLDALVANQANIDTVADNLNGSDTIGTVAGSIANVNATGANIADVTTVADNLNGSDTIGTVAGIDSEVTTVAGISADVTTVSGISSDVATVSGISSDVTAVAADASDIGTVADSIADVGTVARIASDISTVVDNLVGILAAEGYADDAETAALAANNSASACDAIYEVTSAAQAQANALLGLGIGSAYTDAEGDLIMTYNDTTVTSVEINASGHLTITY